MATSAAPEPSSPSTTSLDSLPSSPSTCTSTETSPHRDGEILSDAEREWRESLQQLELLLTMVLIPFVGKYFGRRCAYWGWAKFMEWKYPVSVVMTSPAAFKGAGLAEAATSL